MGLLSASPGRPLATSTAEPRQPATDAAKHNPRVSTMARRKCEIRKAKSERNSKSQIRNAAGARSSICSCFVLVSSFEIRASCFICAVTHRLGLQKLMHLWPMPEQVRDVVANQAAKFAAD